MITVDARLILDNLLCISSEQVVQNINLVHPLVKKTVNVVCLPFKKPLRMHLCDVLNTKFTNAHDPVDEL